MTQAGKRIGPPPPPPPPPPPLPPNRAPAYAMFGVGGVGLIVDRKSVV